MKRVRLKDIAEKAGVSVQTVSMALRDHASVSGKRRKELQALAEEMGYERDPFLQGLAMYRSKQEKHRVSAVIGVLTSEEFSAERKKNHQIVKEAIDARARAHGYRTEWLRVSDFVQQGKNALKNFGIEGVLSFGVDVDFANVGLAWDDFALVSLMSRQTTLRCHEVVTRIYEPAYDLLTKTLHEEGKKVALVMYENDRISTTRAYRGAFLNACRDLKIEGLQAPMLSGVNTTSVQEAKMLCQWIVKEKIQVLVGAGIFRTPPSPYMDLYHWLERVSPKTMGKNLSYIDFNIDSAEYDFNLGLRPRFRDIGALGVEVLVRELQMRSKGLPTVPTSLAVEPVQQGDVDKWKNHLLDC